jgi:hypothetical protein
MEPEAEPKQSKACAGCQPDPKAQLACEARPVTKPAPAKVTWSSSSALLAVVSDHDEPKTQEEMINALKADLLAEIKNAKKSKSNKSRRSSTSSSSDSSSNERSRSRKRLRHKRKGNKADKGKKHVQKHKNKNKMKKKKRTVTAKKLKKKRDSSSSFCSGFFSQDFRGNLCNCICEHCRSASPWFHFWSGMAGSCQYQPSKSRKSCASQTHGAPSCSSNSTSATKSTSASASCDDAAGIG